MVPRPRETLDRFLDEESFYSHDRIAGVLAGVTGIAALLLAANRDLGDDRAACKPRSPRCWLRTRWPAES